MRMTCLVLCGLLVVVAAGGGDVKDLNISETMPMTILQEKDDRLVAVLPNRMIVAVQRVTAAPVVSAQVWVKTGSIYEQEHVGAGLSHFLEHLVAGGSTTTRSEAESNAMLGSIGGQTNAATSLDNVHYYINTTADHAGTAIALLSDWLANNRVDPAEFAREQEVIQSEFKMGQADPGRIFWKLTQRARYAAHPARHPTIGYLDQFMTISRDQIHAFYKRMYVPNNMVFVVAGDVDPRETVRQIAGLWGDIEPRPLPELRFPRDTRPEGPVSVSGFADIRRPRLRLALPNVRLGEPGDFELDMLAVILGQGESSRLVRLLRDQEGLVSSIDAFNWSTTWGEAMFGIDCEVIVPEIPPNVRADPAAWRQARIEAVRQAILDQLAGLRDRPVSPEELARAKRKTLAAVVRSGQTAAEVASTLARDILGPGDPDYHDRYIAGVQALTAEQLQAAAKRLLVDSALVTVTLLPKAPGQVLAPLDRAEDVTLPDDAYERFDLDNRQVVQRLRAHVGQADAGRPVEVGPLTVHRLDNGLPVLIQRSTLVPAVSVQLYSLGGLLADQPGREGLAHATAVMQRRGTATRSAQEIAVALEDLGLTLSTASGNSTSYVHGSGLAEDLPALMAMVADVTLRPSFPEDQWQTMRTRLLAAIDRERENIWGEIRHAFREVRYAGHPWSQPATGRREVVAKLTAEDLRRFHAANLGADRSVLAIVGDLDPDAALALAAEHFGGMPAGAPSAFEAPQPGDHAGGVEQGKIDKPGSAVQIGFEGIARDHPDYARLQVMGRVMSDFPAGYLEQELRGRGPGIAYGVHAGLFTGVVPGYFAIVFNTRDPALTVEGVRRSMDVVRRMRDGDFTEADLVRARAKVRTEEATSRQSNGGRAAAAALDLLYGVHDPDGSGLLEAVNRVRLADVQDAARRYLADPLLAVVTSELIDQAELAEALGAGGVVVD